VYTNIQPVAKPVVQPAWQLLGCLFTQCSRLSSRLYNRFHNRLYRVNGVLRERKALILRCVPFSALTVRVGWQYKHIRPVKITVLPRGALPEQVEDPRWNRVTHLHLEYRPLNGSCRAFLQVQPAIQPVIRHDRRYMYTCSKADVSQLLHLLHTMQPKIKTEENKEAKLKLKTNMLRRNAP